MVDFWITAIDNNACNLVSQINEIPKWSAKFKIFDHIGPFDSVNYIPKFDSVNYILKFY